MADIGIRVNAEQCTGCRVCQLICSITYQERFSPDEAYIRLEESGPRYVEGCVDCGLCADHCPAGALEREEGANGGEQGAQSHSTEEQETKSHRSAVDRRNET